MKTLRRQDKKNEECTNIMRISGTFEWSASYEWFESQLIGRYTVSFLVDHPMYFADAALICTSYAAHEIIEYALRWEIPAVPRIDDILKDQLKEKHAA